MRLVSLVLTAVLLVIALPVAQAQDSITPLRVEEAITGQLTAASPTVIYSFNVAESQRMAVVFDVIEGDMQPTLVVLDQDQKTVLAGATGPGANGVIVNFPVTGTYYLSLTADAGNSATYRLLINAAPVLPIYAFVMQSYLVRGASTVCDENTPTGWFAPTDDLNVCFVLFNLDDSTALKVEWWSPSGTLVTEEGGTLDSSFNGRALLSGLAFPGEPFEEGWWQAHIVLDGELAYIQWVPVVSAGSF